MLFDHVFNQVLHLHGWVALTVVFVMPLLESATFVGLVFPAEIVVVLGGVLAFEHQVGLSAVVAASAAGAVLGDTIGYATGHRFGRRLLATRLVAKVVTPGRRQHAEDFLRRHGGQAVVLGRFTAALRVLIPGLAGMARLPYRKFLAFNLLGGSVWAAASVMLGYLAGSSWQLASQWFSLIGLGLLAIVVTGLLTRRQLLRLARRCRKRFPRQADWAARRLTPRSPTGVALTGHLVVAVLAGWVFAGLTHDVVAEEDLAQIDRPIHAVVGAHRTTDLTAVLQALTWLGSNMVLLPVLAAAAAALLLRRRVADFAWLSLAYLGSLGLYSLIKMLVHRTRPPDAGLLTAVSGWSYPSGHATQAVAAWGCLALLAAAHAPRARWSITGAAALIALMVGGSRIYLGAHWTTDVLAGWTLAAAWLALLGAARLILTARSAAAAAATASPDRGAASSPETA